jgi:hypothetical protein
MPHYLQDLAARSIKEKNACNSTLPAAKVAAKLSARAGAISKASISVR